VCMCGPNVAPAMRSCGRCWHSVSWHPVSYCTGPTNGRMPAGKSLFTEHSDSELMMSSLLPSLSLGRLRTAFSASWNWSNRPAYHFKIRHQFELGGFDVKAGPGIDLDPMGLYWMRTLELLSRNTGIAYRMIHFDDLNVILLGFPGPSPEMLEKMYGNRIHG
jgi:hypothetical protein